MTTAADSVIKTVTVEAPRRRAFDVFTRGFADWWPLEGHHIGEKDAETVVMEPRPGGRWFERAADGSECDWGHVIAFDPPERVLLAWQLNADFRYDPGLVTEVEVRFVEEGEGRTRVELEHRNLERFGERAEEVRSSIGSDGGWGSLLRMYAESAERQTP